MMPEPDPKSWYKTAKWQKKRAKQLAKHPLCAFCQNEGKITAATVADHVTPHKGDAHLFWHGALQSLCKTCHDSTKRRLERGSKPRVAIGADGWPIPPGGG